MAKGKNKKVEPKRVEPTTLDLVTGLAPTVSESPETAKRSKTERIRRVNNHVDGTWTGTIIGTRADVVVLMSKLWPNFKDLASNVRELCFAAVNNKVGDSAAGDETDDERLKSMVTVREALYNNTASFSAGGRTGDPVTKVLREFLHDDLTSGKVNMKSVEAWKAIRTDEQAAYNVVLASKGIVDEAAQALFWTDYQRKAEAESNLRASRRDSVDPDDMAAKLEALQAAAAAALAAESEVKAA